jgi:hypothetical protein
LAEKTPEGPYLVRALPKPPTHFFFAAFFAAFLAGAFFFAAFFAVAMVSPR